MTQKNIQIMGISETRLLQQQSKYLFQFEHSQYTTFFYNEQHNRISKGVGLIVKNNIAHHIYRHGNFKERIIFIDLIFKNAKKLRIIQYYGIVKRRLQEKKQEFIETINKLMKYISST
jgi:hypothetical protein